MTGNLNGRNATPFTASYVVNVCREAAIQKIHSEIGKKTTERALAANGYNAITPEGQLARSGQLTKLSLDDVMSAIRSLKTS